MSKSPSPSLPKGRESIPAEFKDVGVQLLPLGEGWDGASMLDGTHPRQLRQSCCCLCKPLPMPSPKGESSLEAPPHALPKGQEFHFAVFEVVVWCSFPLGKAGMGLWMGLVFLLLPPWRIGRSPEKLQIFLCYSPIDFLPVLE